MAIMGVSLVSAGLFVALQDAGGWMRAGVIATALVPLLGLAALAWWRPAVAVPLLTVFTAVAVAGSALDGDFGKLEGIGGIAKVAHVGALVGATALGHRRARAGGLMLLAIGLTPAILGVQTLYMVPATVSGARADRLAPLIRRPGVGDRRGVSPARSRRAGSAGVVPQWRAVCR